jgi:hypothetical protein
MVNSSERIDNNVENQLQYKFEKYGMHKWCIECIDENNSINRSEDKSIFIKPLTCKCVIKSDMQDKWCFILNFTCDNAKIKNANLILNLPKGLDGNLETLDGFLRYANPYKNSTTYTINVSNVNYSDRYNWGYIELIFPIPKDNSTYDILFSNISLVDFNDNNIEMQDRPVIAFNRTTSTYCGSGGA